MNQSINRTNNGSINESIDQCTNQTINQSSNGPINRSIDWWLLKFTINQSIKHETIGWTLRKLNITSFWNRLRQCTANLPQTSRMIPKTVLGGQIRWHCRFFSEFRDRWDCPIGAIARSFPCAASGGCRLPRRDSVGLVHGAHGSGRDNYYWTESLRNSKTGDFERSWLAEGASCVQRPSGWGRLGRKSGLPDACYRWCDAVCWALRRLRRGSGDRSDFDSHYGSEWGGVRMGERVWSRRKGCPQCPPCGADPSSPPWSRSNCWDSSPIARYNLSEESKITSGLETNHGTEWKESSLLDSDILDSNQSSNRSDVLYEWQNSLMSVFIRPSESSLAKSIRTFIFWKARVENVLSVNKKP